MGGRGATLGKSVGKTVNLSQPKGTPLNSKFLQGMSDTINKEGTDLAKQIYAKFMGNVEFGRDIPAKDRAHYHPFTKQVFFNQADAAKGDALYNPYEKAFHEFGHAIDDTKKTLFSTKHHSSELDIPTFLSQDFHRYKKKMGFKSNTQAFDYLKSKYSVHERGPVSDALEGVTKRGYPLDVGHGVRYHKIPGKTATEFFANTLSTQASNPRGYKLLKEVFPQAVAVVEKRLKDML